MGIGVNARTAFSLLFPPILDEFGWERGVTAGAFSFGFLVSAVLSPSLGPPDGPPRPARGDRARRAPDRRGPAARAAGAQPWHLYATLGVLVGGGSVCLGYTGQALFLPNWFVRRRGLAMSLAFSGVGVGSIILLPWLQTLIERAGLARRVLGDAASSSWCCWCRSTCCCGGGPRTWASSPTAIAPRPPRRGGAGPSNVVDAAWAAVDWTLARAMRTARFWWIAVGYFCGLFAWYAVQVHQTKYLIEIGFSPTRRGVGARPREPRRHPRPDRARPSLGPDRPRVGVDGGQRWGSRSATWRCSCWRSPRRRRCST